jgi:LemA protein
LRRGLRGCDFLLSSHPRAAPAPPTPPAPQLREQRKQKNKMVGAVTAGVLALGMTFSYNSLNGERVQALEQRSNLQSVLQRRAELVPQLTKITEQGAAHEKALADRLARASEGLRSGDVATQLKANEELNQALTTLSESKGAQGAAVYRDLMAEVAGSENRINVARSRYNAAASRYNRAASSFPTSLVRPLVGMPAEMPFYESTAK